jgi:hypothetical protein
MNTTILVIAEESLSEELRYAANHVHRMKGSAGSVKSFEKLFTKEARALGILKPKERWPVSRRFGMLYVERPA